MPEPSTTRAPSSLDPLRSANFRKLWGANLAVSLASLMQQTAAAWLMADLTNSPLQVGLVQTAAMLPGVLLSLPGGVLGDVVDRRRMLLATLLPMAVAALLGFVLTAYGSIGPVSLLLITVVVGASFALLSPVSHTCQVEAVPPAQIPLAVPLTSTTYNAARAVGPALAGAMMAAWGAAAVFAASVVGYVAAIVGIATWRAPSRPPTVLPETLVAGLRGAWRFARHSDAVRLQVLRTVLFIGAASALLALLPFVARDLLRLGAGGFGTLLGVFGIGAVLGATLIGLARRVLGLNGAAEVSTATFALSLLVLAFVPWRAASLVAVLVCGATWMLVGNTHVTALQTAIPGWVRSRAMSIYMLTFQGCSAVGGVLWGSIASASGTRAALVIAAVATLLAAVAMRFRRVDLGEPERHAPAVPLDVPVPCARAEFDGGPVVVEIAYRIDPAARAEFVAAAHELGVARRRNGAYRWRLLLDLADETQYSERFLADSWADYLRHESRATVADRELEGRVAAFHAGPGAPSRRHHIATAPAG